MRGEAATAVATTDLGLSLEEAAGHLEARVAGRYADCVDCPFWIFERIALECRVRGKRRVLVDVTRVEGDVPDIERYELSVHAARSLGHLERVAVLLGSPQRGTHIFEVVALSRGLPGRVFETRAAALAWLGPAPDHR